MILFRFRNKRETPYAALALFRLSAHLFFIIWERRFLPAAVMP